MAVDPQMMAAVASGDDIEHLLAQMSLDHLPGLYHRNLHCSKGSLCLFVPAEAWQQTEHSLDEPGTVDVFHLPGEDVLIVDLSHE